MKTKETEKIKMLRWWEILLLLLKINSKSDKKFLNLTYLFNDGDKENKNEGTLDPRLYRNETRVQSSSILYTIYHYSYLHITCPIHFDIL